MSGGRAPHLRAALKRKAPGLDVERALWADGASIVAGIDEVGRGAWAGPLTLAAVVVPRDKRLYKVRDSKMLTAAEREVMYERLLDWAEHVSVAHATQVECDELGMSAAQLAPVGRSKASVSRSIMSWLTAWDFVETVGHDVVKAPQSRCRSQQHRSSPK